MTSKYAPVSDWPFIVADTETTGLDWRTDKVFAVAVAHPTGDCFYYNMARDNDAAWLREELPRAKHIVNHHIKFDLHMAHSTGIRLDPRRVTCTMITAALLNENEDSYSLDHLGLKYAGIGKDETIWEELAAMFGGAATRKAQIMNLARAPDSLAGRYAMRDVLATLKLWEWQRPQIAEQQLERVFKVEHELLAVLFEVERHGVALDVAAAKSNAKALTARTVVLQKQLDQMVGRPVNVNSAPQMNKLLVKEQLTDGGFLAVDGVTVFPATESGKAASIKSEQLRHVAHPIAEAVVELRSLHKTVDTFINGHLLKWADTGRIHCNYNQTRSDNDLGTGTGRLSVNDPPLQQINKRDPRIAPFVRGCFVPDMDEEWCSLDWSQMDFRMFAHYANAPSVIEAYAADPFVDYHGLVAKLANLPRDRKPGTGGGNAKQINLGMVFGMQPGRMAQEMGLPYTKEKGRSGRDWLKPGPEAEEVFARYHEAVPGVKDLLATASSIAKSRGFVKTALGRRIRFPDGNKSYKAAGLVFQGSAADALKVKLIEVHDILRADCGHLLLNVHDEFDLSLPFGSRRVRAEVVHAIEQFGPNDLIPLRVPIRCSFGAGANWWQASGEADDTSSDYRR